MSRQIFTSDCWSFQTLLRSKYPSHWKWSILIWVETVAWFWDFINLITVSPDGQLLPDAKSIRHNQQSLLSQGNSPEGGHGHFKKKDMCHQTQNSFSNRRPSSLLKVQTATQRLIQNHERAFLKLPIFEFELSVFFIQLYYHPVHILKFHPNEMLQ